MIQSSTCQNCDTPIEKNNNRIYCSDKCRKQARRKLLSNTINNLQPNNIYFYDENTYVKVVTINKQSPKVKEQLITFETGTIVDGDYNLQNTLTLEAPILAEMLVKNKAIDITQPELLNANNFTEKRILDLLNGKSLIDSVIDVELDNKPTTDYQNIIELLTSSNPDEVKNGKYLYLQLTEFERQSLQDFFASQQYDKYDFDSVADYFDFLLNQTIETDIENKPQKKSLSKTELQAFFDTNKTIEALIDEKGVNGAYSPQEKKLLLGYSGYGGLADFFDKGTADRGILYEYYTPDLIIEKMWGLAYKYGYTGGPVLEPAAGIGSVIKYAPITANVTAFETNPYSAKILQILYPDIQVINAKFETAFLDETKRKSIKDKVEAKYDLVIGNPPYGRFSGDLAAFEKPYTKAQSYIDYFLTRGLDLLKPGGLLVYIIGGEIAAGAIMFMDQELNHVKKIIQSKSELLDNYQLPNGVFDRATVLTQIMVLRKK